MINLTKLNDLRKALSSGKRIFFWLSLLLLSTADLYAVSPEINQVEQQRTAKVIGKITETGGDALPGATIQIKGSTRGVIADVDGNYEFSDCPIDSLAVNYPHPTKWGGYDSTDDFGYALVKDWPLMRLGETYLLRAEARFRQGNNQGAADDINVLRNRAFKSYRISSGNADAGKVTAAHININFILDERVRELIAEENRRMTLMRTNTLKERIALNGDKTPQAPDNKVITGFQDFNVLLPIPLTEIQINNGASLEQNPGYN